MSRFLWLFLSITCLFLLSHCHSSRRSQSVPPPPTVVETPKLNPKPEPLPPPIPELEEIAVVPDKPAPTPEPKPATPRKDLPFSIAADRIDEYLPLLSEQRIALVVNQTSISNQTHLADALMSLGIDLKKVFAPEHGFRGDADAGEYVSNGKDKITGLPIISLYGKHKKPSTADLADIDIVIFDIQDVGARFYTYISTMHYIMEACAENNKHLIVLDRPNPNGHYIDGPVLNIDKQSFVGMHPIPIVHGLTVGELAMMINGEKWLAGGRQCQLTVILCLGYTHQYHYELPIKPSPNLPNSRAIYLYPSLCLFEGTPISVGRGTDQQFQIFGAPALTKMPYQFTPVSKPGAKTPPHQNVRCYGLDLTSLSIAELQRARQINLKWLLDCYKAYPDKDRFFNANLFFDQLAGTDELRRQIRQQRSEKEIRQSWQPALNRYKAIRQKYLLYPD